MDLTVVLLVWIQCTLIQATYWGVPNAGPRSAFCFLPYSATKAVVFGGDNFEFLALNDVHLYDVASNRWTSVVTFGDVPEPRSASNCFVANSTLYVIGGESTAVFGAPVTVFGDLYALDLNTFVWTRRAEPLVVQGGAASAWVNGLFVVFGGQPNSVNLTTAQLAPCTNITSVYDPVRDRWTQIWTRNAPPASCFAAMTASGTKAFLTGGSPTAPNSDVYFPVAMWQFDTETMQWTLIPAHGPMASERSGHAMVADPSGDVVYVVGGSVECCLLSDVSAFNLTSGEWSLVASLPVTLVSMGAFAVSNALFIYGGYAVEDTSSTLYVVDTTTHQITERTAIDDSLSMADQRFWYGDAVYNSTWFIFGGALGSTFVTSNDLLALDLATLEWSLATQTGTIPPPLMGHSLCVWDNRALLFGGEAADYAPIYNDTYSLDLTTGHWTYVPVTGALVTAVSFHTAVMWRNRMVVFGGVDCCQQYNVVSVLDFNSSPAVWSLPTIRGVLPVARRNHNAVLVDNAMYIFGGYPGLSDVWSLDLMQWTWTLYAPLTNPLARTNAASVLVASKWYINGGQDTSANTLSDTWVYDLLVHQWTQIAHLDAGTPVPLPVMNHKGVLSPFGDGRVIWGPGTPKYQTQVLTPGFHNVTVSETTGSDALCQIDEAKPCQTFDFALSRFAGDSYLEFTVSEDLLNQLSIGTSQRIVPALLHVPVLIRGTQNVVIDCQGATCFTIINVQSNPFTLVNVTLQNGQGINGGVILAVQSTMDLQSVTIQNSYAQQGGAIYLDHSTLVLSGVTLINNSAATTGGAICAYNQSVLSSQASRLLHNRAGLVGGAIYVVASTVNVMDTNFTANQIPWNSTAAAGTLLRAGGAVGAIDSFLYMQSCLLEFNAVSDSGYGGAVFGYTTDVQMMSVQLMSNTAMYGGAIASLSVPDFAASMLTSVLETSHILLLESTLVANMATQGGALYVTDGQAVELVASQCLGNVAADMGGALLVSSTHNVLVDGCVFTNNICLHGDGGALVVLGTSANVTGSSHFTSNSSPEGGGGAIYWGTSSDSTCTATPGIAPTLEAGTELLHNYAAFGHTVASDAADLVLEWTVYPLQNASQVMRPAVVVNIVDFALQTVLVNGSILTAYALPDNAISTNGRVVSSVNGQALFDALTVTAAPRSSFQLWFVMKTTNGALQTPVLHVSTDICHPGWRNNVALQRCDLCPPRTTTFEPMYNGTCLALNQAGDPLTWSANAVLVCIGLLVSGLFLCLASSYIRRFVNSVLGSDKMTGWFSSFRWIWFNLMLADVSQVVCMTQFVTVSTTIPNASESLLTGLPWMFTCVVQLPVVGLLHGVALVILCEALVYQKAERRAKRIQEVTVLASHAGLSADDAPTSTDTKDAKGSNTSSNPVFLTDDEKMAKRNRSRLARMGWRPVTLIGASATCHFMASAVNVWLCLYGATRASLWTLVTMPNASLFGYWLVPGSVLFAFIMYFRITWDHEQYSWTRHLFSLSISWLWLAIHWSVWLTQPLVYQVAPASASVLFAATGSSLLTVALVMLCPLVVFAGLHLVISRRDVDLNNVNLLRKNKKLHADFHHVTSILWGSGRMAAATAKLARGMNANAHYIQEHWIAFDADRYADQYPRQDLDKPGRGAGSKTRFDDLVSHVKSFAHPTLNVFARALTTSPASWSEPLQIPKTQITTFGSGSRPVKSEATYKWGGAASIQAVLESTAALPPFIEWLSKCRNQENVLAALAITNYKSEVANTVCPLTMAQKKALATIIYDWWIGNGEEALSGSPVNISQTQRAQVANNIATGTHLDTVFDVVLAELINLLAQDGNTEVRKQSLDSLGILPSMLHVMKMEVPKAFEVEVEADTDTKARVAPSQSQTLSHSLNAAAGFRRAQSLTPGSLMSRQTLTKFTSGVPHTSVEMPGVVSENNQATTF